VTDSQTTELFDLTSPGNVDCLAKAKPGEPIFILMGRDPVMAAVLQTWATSRERMISAGAIPNTPEEREHIATALRIAKATVEWQQGEQAPVGRQAAYQAARAAHRAAIFAQADTPDWAG
jgi:hypothetical protein